MAATIRVRKPLSSIYMASVEGVWKASQTHKVVSKMVNQMGHLIHMDNIVSHHAF